MKHYCIIHDSSTWDDVTGRWWSTLMIKGGLECNTPKTSPTLKLMGLAHTSLYQVLWAAGGKVHSASPPTIYSLAWISHTRRFDANPASASSKNQLIVTAMPLDPCNTSRPAIMRPCSFSSSQLHSFNQVLHKMRPKIPKSRESIELYLSIYLCRDSNSLNFDWSSQVRALYIT